MPDEAPPGGPPLESVEEVRVVWDLFRSGGIVPCPTDAAPMALSVDGSAAIYRLVCTRCGTSSPWFESGANGVVLRTGPGRTRAEEGMT